MEFSSSEGGYQLVSELDVDLPSSAITFEGVADVADPLHPHHVPALSSSLFNFGYYSVPHPTSAPDPHQFQHSQFNSTVPIHFPYHKPSSVYPSIPNPDLQQYNHHQQYYQNYQQIHQFPHKNFQLYDYRTIQYDQRPSFESPKMDVEPFNGDGGIMNWLSQIEYYFYVYQVPGDEKMGISLSFLKDEALEWTRGYMKASEVLITWNQFQHDIKHKFFKWEHQVAAQNFSMIQHTNSALHHEREWEGTTPLFLSQNQSQLPCVNPYYEDVVRHEVMQAFEEVEEVQVHNSEPAPITHPTVEEKFSEIDSRNCEDETSFEVVKHEEEELCEDREFSENPENGYMDSLDKDTGYGKEYRCTNYEEEYPPLIPNFSAKQSSRNCEDKDADEDLYFEDEDTYSDAEVECSEYDEDDGFTIQVEDKITLQPKSEITVDNHGAALEIQISDEDEVTEARSEENDLLIALDASRSTIASIDFQVSGLSELEIVRKIDHLVSVSVALSLSGKQDFAIVQHSNPAPNVNNKVSFGVDASLKSNDRGPWPTVQQSQTSQILKTPPRQPLKPPWAYSSSSFYRTPSVPTSERPLPKPPWKKNYIPAFTRTLGGLTKTLHNQNPRTSKEVIAAFRRTAGRHGICGFQFRELGQHSRAFLQTGGRHHKVGRRASSGASKPHPR